MKMCKHLVLLTFLSTLWALPSLAAVTGLVQRFQVADSTAPHYRVFGQVGNFCTGTLIGPRHVLTAAHCIYSPDLEHVISQTTFAPARNGSLNPYGIFESENIYVHPDWYVSRAEWADVAVIVLKEPVGKTLGWLDYGFNSQESSPSPLGGFSRPGTIVGYPGDKPDGTMWVVACDFWTASALPLEVTYLCDTMGGMSGAALTSASRSAFRGATIFGLHTLGRGTNNAGLPMWGSAQRFIADIVKTHP